MTKKKALSITIPWSLYEEMKKAAEKDCTSINQWICIAIAKEITRISQKQQNGGSQ